MDERGADGRPISALRPSFIDDLSLTVITTARLYAAMVQQTQTALGKTHTSDDRQYRR